MDDLSLLRTMIPSVQNAKQGQETNRVKFLARDTTVHKMFSLNNFAAVYGRFALVELSGEKT